MAMKTKRQVSTAVARKLGIVDSLHSPSAADAAYIEGEYDDLYAMYADKETIYWPNTGRDVEEIPDVIFSALVDILCGNVNGAFAVEEPAVSDERGSRIPISTRGWRNLKKHISRQGSGLPTRARFF